MKGSITVLATVAALLYLGFGALVALGLARVRHQVRGRWRRAVWSSFIVIAPVGWALFLPTAPLAALIRRRRPAKEADHARRSG